HCGPERFRPWIECKANRVSQAAGIQPFTASVWVEFQDRGPPGVAFGTDVGSRANRHVHPVGVGVEDDVASPMLAVACGRRQVHDLLGVAFGSGLSRMIFVPDDGTHGSDIEVVMPKSQSKRACKSRSEFQQLIGSSISIRIFEDRYTAGSGLR